MQVVTQAGTLSCGNSNQLFGRRKSFLLLARVPNEGNDFLLPALAERRVDGWVGRVVGAVGDDPGEIDCLLAEALSRQGIENADGECVRAQPSDLTALTLTALTLTALTLTALTLTALTLTALTLTALTLTALTLTALTLTALTLTALTLTTLTLTALTLTTLTLTALTLTALAG